MQNSCINISERLKAIADFVREGSVVADIGTDHAFLPIYLLQKGKINSAVAVDINEGPLEIAKKHLKEFELSDKVKTFISNGLKKVEPGSVDDIVIAGMGGELIAEILNNSKWVKNRRYRLVLQPMTRPEALRKFLFENCFEIKNEKTVCEANKLYTIIVAEFTGIKRVFSESDLYIGELSENSDDVTVSFLRKTVKSLSFAYKGAVIRKEREKAEIIYNVCKDICGLIGEDVDDYC